MKKLLCVIFLISIPLMAQTPPAPEQPRLAIPPPAAPPSPEERITPETEREALEFLAIVAPFRLEDTKRLKTVQPQEYYRNISEVLSVKRRLDFVKRNDPEQYQLVLQETKMDQQSHNLAEQCRRTKNPEEKNRLRIELKNLLTQLFDIREKNKQREIQHLETELNRLRNTMSERRKNKDQIVMLRMEELLDEQTSLKW
jgi:hypothetical protein